MKIRSLASSVLEARRSYLRMVGTTIPPRGTIVYEAPVILATYKADDLVASADMQSSYATTTFMAH